MRLLSILFSLSLHGVIAGLLISVSYKVAETYPITIQVLWEKPSEDVNAPQQLLSKKALLSSSSQQNTTILQQSHSRVSGNPETSYNASKASWVPTYAGMTPSYNDVQTKQSKKQGKNGRNSGLTTPKMTHPKKLSGTEEHDKPIQKTPYTPLPPYPWICRKRGQEGRVYLRVETNKEGQVTKVHLHKSSGYAPLDQAALDMVKTWILSYGSYQKVISIAFRLKG